MGIRGFRRGVIDAEWEATGELVAQVVCGECGARVVAEVRRSPGSTLYIRREQLRRETPQVDDGVVDAVTDDLRARPPDDPALHGEPTEPTTLRPVRHLSVVIQPIEKTRDVWCSKHGVLPIPTDAAITAARGTGRNPVVLEVRSPPSAE